MLPVKSCRMLLTDVEGGYDNNVDIWRDLPADDEEECQINFELSERPFPCVYLLSLTPKERFVG